MLRINVLVMGLMLVAMGAAVAWTTGQHLIALFTTLGLAGASGALIAFAIEARRMYPRL